MHEHKSSKKLCFEILQELAEPGRVKSSFQSAKNLVKVGHQSLDQVRSKKASTMHQSLFTTLLKKNWSQSYDF
jgi:hypothetical protein